MNVLRFIGYFLIHLLTVDTVGGAYRWRESIYPTNAKWVSGKIAGTINCVFYIALCIVIYQATTNIWLIPVTICAAVAIHVLTVVIPINLILLPLSMIWFIASIMKGIGVYNYIPIIQSLPDQVNPWILAVACLSFFVYQALHTLHNELQLCIFVGMCAFFVLRTVNIAYLAFVLNQWWLAIGALLFVCGGILIALAFFYFAQLLNPGRSSSISQTTGMGVGLLFAGILFICLFSLTASERLWTYLSVERLWLRKDSIPAQKDLEHVYLNSSGVMPGMDT